ncbi:MAG: FG-GAP-like repeat-containing protein [Planctomycetota bacterium]
MPCHRNARPRPGPSTTWVDFDGGGLRDLYLTTPGAPDRLLANAGDGTFDDVTAEAGLGGLSDSRSVHWGDVDGDGRQDLLVVAGSGSLRLFYGLGKRSFPDGLAAVGLAGLVDVRSAEWIDYDEDGLADLHLETDAGVRLLHQETGGTFSELATLPSAQSAPGATPIASRANGLATSPAPTAGGSASGGSARASSVSTAPMPTPAGAASDTAAYCPNAMIDQANGMCSMQGASVPTFGMLYPLGNDWLIEPKTRFMGVGAVDPLTQLDVNGTVRSRSGGVMFPDGTLQTTAQLTGPAGPEGPAGTQGPTGPTGLAGPAGPTGPEGLLIGGAEDQMASHDGTTWVPAPFLRHDGSFMALADDLNNDYRLTVGAAELAAVRGNSNFGPTPGYLGVQGSADFDGVSSADLAGQLGVVGISTGSGAANNTGALGHSSGVGVRGENSGNPTQDFAELGLDGIGVRASGAALAGSFTGDVLLDGDAELTGTFLGDVDVEGKLEAGGGVRFADGSLQTTAYVAPGTQRYTVGNGDFVGTAVTPKVGLTAGLGGTHIDSESIAPILAGVHLPDGATVTNVTFHGYDDADGILVFELLRGSFGSAGGVVMASFQSCVPPGAFSGTDSTIAAAVIDNQNHSYFVRVRPSVGTWDPDGELAVNAVVIGYTTD